MKIMDMPIMKKKRTVASQAAARGPLPELPEGLLDELVKGPMTPVTEQPPHQPPHPSPRPQLHPESPA
ncbi:hypothetical protein GGD41_006545 [Paraburkholderia bryophila]|uniref:Uncharacterized protein n=1 Tax=Paraburkholderia bryophila TaxID=420952 RepID=A0A7Y9WEF7_9BURK|nr:hypothetical protein [Paraburkholderia bryophila]